MKIHRVQFIEFASHRDLRCGLGLIQFQDVVNEFAKSQTPTIKLGKVLTLEYGSGLTEDDRSGTEFPVVGSNGIIGYHDEYLIEGPCIIVGRKGSAGEITYIEENCYPIDTTFYVKLHSDLFEIKYLYYLLKALKLQRLALFKGVPGLNRYDVYEAKIPLVSDTKQLEIISKLEEIEKEVELLRQQIRQKEKQSEFILKETISVPVK